MTRQSAIIPLSATASGPPSASQQVLPASPSPVAILFSPPVASGSSVTFSTSEAIDALSASLTLEPTSGPLAISLETHGTIVQHAWYAISSSGSGVECAVMTTDTI